jgi:triacylglycerol esterase/lipase EstA (alpha/beta hydrolase family)
MARSAAALVLGLGFLWAGAPPGTADSGPALTVAEAQMAGAVQCDAGAMSGTRTTVLLLHGTGGTAQEVWSWNYEKSLPDAGFGVCAVTLPDRALGSFAASAEYAVYAARYAHQVSGRRIAILGHSQAGLMAAWIAKFWPDVAGFTDDVISFAGPMNGTALADALCAAQSCSPIAWQLGTNSKLTKAFQNSPLPAQTSFTSIASAEDEIVFPQPVASALPGGRTVLVQDVCPGRIADHGSLLIDAVSYRLVIDALTHDGPADPARIGASACGDMTMPGMDAAGIAEFSKTLAALTDGLMNPMHWVAQEPPLPAYAARYGG